MSETFESENFIPVCITVRCTQRSVAPTREGEYPDPGGGPEFEIEEITAGEDQELVTWSSLIDFVGLDEAERLEEKAKEEASKSGRF